MGMIGWNRGLVETVVEWWHPVYDLHRPYPVRWWSPWFWFGKRWYIVVDDGQFSYEPYFKYLTHQQLAWKTLKERYGQNT